MAQDTKTDTSTVGSNPFGALTTMLEQFKVPGADMRTLAEMAHKLQVDAVASLTGRVKENMEELQHMLVPK